MGFNIRVNRVRVENTVVNNNPMHSIIIPELYSLKHPGEPLLPSISRMIAIPQNSRLEVRITGSRKTVIPYVVPLCNPESIPENPAHSLIYKPDSSIYFGYNLYPQEIITVSEPFKIRGVDVCIVTITPFQWNPSDSSLTIYTSLNLQASFMGGNGHFGEDRLRGRYWDRILQSNLMNYRSLDRIDYSQRVIEKQSLKEIGYPYGAEFVIITPDNEDFIYYANVMKNLRQEEGIIADVYTLSEVGTTFEQIENWIDYAYYSWPIAPEAILLLGDCKDASFPEGIPSRILSVNPPEHGFYTYASDNYYADVDNDINQLPDIAIGRIPARNSNDLENYFEKLLSYELNPITDNSFYQNVLVSGGFEYDSLTANWSDHHVISEITKGFFENIESKVVTRLYIYKKEPDSLPPDSIFLDTTWLPNPGDHPLTPGRLDYFISLGYITERITEDFLQTSLWCKTATNINTSINNGCFLVYNHGHGGVDYDGGPSHWSSPWYYTSDIAQLHNYNKFPYVYALCCWTGKFDDPLVNHAEKFILLEPDPSPRGSLGNTAASMSWWGGGCHFHGYLDFLYPDFDPLYPLLSYSGDTFQEALPGFALVSGKYYAETRMAGWSTGEEIEKFHHFGDPYLRLYTDVPSSMLVTNPSYISAGEDEIYVTAPLNSIISLINDGEIIGRGKGLGLSFPVPVVPQQAGTEIVLIVTKQNCFRYYDTVNVYSSDGVYLRFTQIDTIKTFHHNGQINPTNPGRKDTLILEMVNFGEDNSCLTDFILQTTSPYVNIYDDTLSVSVGAYDTAYLLYEYEVINDPPDKSIADFSLKYDDGSKEFHTDNFSLEINCPFIQMNNISYLPPTPTDTTYLTMSMKNIGSGSLYKGYFKIRTEDTAVVIVDSIFDPEIDEFIPGDTLRLWNMFSMTITDEKLEPVVVVEIEVISDSNYSYKDTIMISWEEKAYFFDNLELNSPYEWTFQGDNSWHKTGIDSYSGDASMYNGLDEQYPYEYENNITDSKVISDSINITTYHNDIKVYLSYYHRYELEEGNDGVQIQAKLLTDTVWTTLYPIDGYPCEANGYGGFDEGEGIFSGEMNQWHKVYFQIDSIFFNNNFQICFKFGSNESKVDEGYYFDDVEIYTLCNPNPIEGDQSIRAYLATPEFFHFWVRPAGSNISTESMAFEYSIPNLSSVTFSIYDIAGREIRNLFRSIQEPGFYSLNWDGRDNMGRNASPGIYFYRIIAGENIQSGKFLIIR
ncbi:MAG: C25 family cysteine peptidase [Kosmotogaceae bacterium]